MPEQTGRNGADRVGSPLLDSAEERERLAGLTAVELVEALRRHFEQVGGLATDTERALGRELVRRARRCEALERENARQRRGQ